MATTPTKASALASSSALLVLDAAEDTAAADDIDAMDCMQFTDDVSDDDNFVDAATWSEDDDEFETGII